VRIIVDANIVFSAILNTNSKIADLLLNSKGIFEYLAPNFLQLEIRKYHYKISKISGLSLIEIQQIENKITKPVVFMSGIHIPAEKWILAEKMVIDIDPKDTPYVAFSLFYKCKIWSGDKALRNGLENKRFKNIISTEELFDYRESKLKTTKKLP
jgi:predicted nucleic acid-binding protein